MRICEVEERWGWSPLPKNLGPRHEEARFQCWEDEWQLDPGWRGGPVSCSEMSRWNSIGHHFLYEGRQELWGQRNRRGPCSKASSKISCIRGDHPESQMLQKTVTAGALAICCCGTSHPPKCRGLTTTISIYFTQDSAIWAELGGDSLPLFPLEEGNSSRGQRTAFRVAPL